MILDRTASLFSKNALGITPEQYMPEFTKEKLNINLSREKVFCFILIVWNALMSIYGAFQLSNRILLKMPAYKYAFYLQLTALIYMSIFMVILCFRKRNIECNKRLKNFLNLAFITFVIIWTSTLTIVAQAIDQQIIVYALGVLGVSVSLNISLKEGCLIYIPTYAILVIGTVLTQDNYAIIESCVLNGAVIVALGLVISRIIYVSQLKDFINRITIAEKTSELENSHKILEEALQKRTDELTSTNEQLVDEINKRYSMEVKALKAELEHRESVRVLNEIKEYDRLRGEFFANISHELRTPLNMIFSLMQVLDISAVKSGLEADKEKNNTYMTMMKQNCYRLLRLVNNLIDMTKIDAGYLEITPGNYDIVGIVEDITQSVVPYAECNGLNVVFDTEIEEKALAFDPDKIERVILNLLSNAVKFTPPGGSILVKIYEENESVIIKVKDTGIGIPPEKQNAIFERFFQVDKTLAREKEGSGIGLSLVKSLVEMHNGRISVVSEPGKGSEFIVELPDKTLESIDDSINKRYENRVQAINVEFSDIYNIG